jgi:hypothetical protein
MKPLWHWSNQSPQKIKEIMARISAKKKGCPPNSGSFRKGQKNKYKGKHLPWIAHIMCGNKNPKWMGDDVSNKSLHQWVKRILGQPKTCWYCHKTFRNTNLIHWANKSHKYLRTKSDWLRLCVKCHKKYDIDFLKRKI